MAIWIQPITTFWMFVDISWPLGNNINYNIYFCQNANGMQLTQANFNWKLHCHVSCCSKVSVNTETSCLNIAKLCAKNIRFYSNPLKLNYIIYLNIYMYMDLIPLLLWFKDCHIFCECSQGWQNSGCGWAKAAMYRRRGK